MEVMIGICACIMSAIIVQLGTSYFKMAGYIPGRCHNKLGDKGRGSKPEPSDIPVLDDEAVLAAKKQMTPTGTIYLRHPNMDMICRVTDRADMPGFIVSCKDSNGAKREFHIYLNKDCTDLKVCTNIETNAVLDADDRICVNYSVPFEDGRKA